MRPPTFRKLAYATLAVTLAVILWGAYVRASGSGAGCGSHWPDCNGQIIPRAENVKTVIEYTHRVTSGASLLLTVAQLIAAFFAFPRGHFARKGAAASMFFMITEAAVGAGLVIFEMVAHNKSLARAIWMGAHLTNTFLLLASMALTIWWSGDKPAPRTSGPRALATYGLAFGLLLVGMAGAIVALGDTLFPAKSLSEGFTQDLTPGAHFLIRLRALHPMLAVTVGAAIAWASRSVAHTAELKRLSNWLNVTFAAQVVAGVVNLALLAPIPMQLVHLLLADLYWIAAIVFGAAYLGTVGAPIASSGKSASESSLIDGSIM